MDAKRISQTQCVQLLVRIYKYKGRGISFNLGSPLPEKTTMPRPAPLNIVAKALEIKAYIEVEPQRTFLDAAVHFKVTRSRISQMMKILEKLPPDLTPRISLSTDRTLLNRFSGRTLLKIADMPNLLDRQQYINQALATLEK